MGFSWFFYVQHQLKFSKIHKWSFINFSAAVYIYTIVSSVQQNLVKFRGIPYNSEIRTFRIPPECFWRIYLKPMKSLPPGNILLNCKYLGGKRHLSSHHESCWWFNVSCSLLVKVCSILQFSVSVSYSVVTDPVTSKILFRQVLNFQFDSMFKAKADKEIAYIFCLPQNI